MCLKKVGESLEFVVKQDSRGYIVIRKDGAYRQHAHLSTLDGCRKLIQLIERGLLPKNTYLQGSCRRLLTEQEYNSLKKPKQKYYNSKNRRVM